MDSMLSVPPVYQYYRTILSESSGHDRLACFSLTADVELISPRDSLPVSRCVQKNGHAKLQSRQPWRRVMPRDTWSPSAARENVITVPPLYIFINEALIGIRGNVPGFGGEQARHVKHSRPFESIAAADSGH